MEQLESYVFSLLSVSSIEGFWDEELERRSGPIILRKCARPETMEEPNVC